MKKLIVILVMIYSTLLFSAETEKPKESNFIKSEKDVKKINKDIVNKEFKHGDLRFKQVKNFDDFKNQINEKLNILFFAKNVKNKQFKAFQTYLPYTLFFLAIYSLGLLILFMKARLGIFSIFFGMINLAAIGVLYYSLKTGDQQFSQYLSASIITYLVTCFSLILSAFRLAQLSTALYMFIAFPIINVIIYIVLCYRIGKRFNKSSLFILFMISCFPVASMMIAFSDDKYCKVE